MRLFSRVTATKRRWWKHRVCAQEIVPLFVGRRTRNWYLDRVHHFVYGPTIFHPSLICYMIIKKKMRLAGPPLMWWTMFREQSLATFKFPATVVSLLVYPELVLYYKLSIKQACAVLIILYQMTSRRLWTAQVSISFSFSFFLLQCSLYSTSLSNAFAYSTIFPFHLCSCGQIYQRYLPSSLCYIPPSDFFELKIEIIIHVSAWPIVFSLQWPQYVSSWALNCQPNWDNFSPCWTFFWVFGQVLLPRFVYLQTDFKLKS